MRKKYDSPAPLTVSLAFDSRLLDLVAGTYETPEQTKDRTQEMDRQKSLFKNRSVTTVRQTKTWSERNFSKTINLTKTRKWAPRISNHININVQSTSLTKLPRFMVNGSKQIEIFSSKLMSENKQKAKIINKDMIKFCSGIEKQTTKSMINNIRKNILSTSITPTKLANLQSTYKLLMTKIKVKPDHDFLI